MLIIAGVLVVGLAAYGALRPVPYAALAPGPVFDTLGPTPGARVPLVEVRGAPVARTTGILDLVTVDVVHPLSLVDAIGDWFSSSTAVVPEQELGYGTGQSAQQVNQADLAQMSQSQDAAEVAALAEIGDYRVTVTKVLPGDPAATVLARGDVLLAVDGTRVLDSAIAAEVIQGVGIGHPVRLTYRTPAGAVHAATLRTVGLREDGQLVAVIGVELTNVEIRPITVTINLPGVGGPSAGMMFTLAAIDKLSGGRLAGDYHVAGTGTISPDLQIGPIGGIQQKMRAARSDGATVFLAPAGDCPSTVGAVPPGLRVVKVYTLAGALDALAALRAGRLATLPSC